ncbi:hypothetical protein A0H76_1149 [Hepatospora eriocheir]|uniref:Uncharacterized protein n=1 Tax=Hepatospora eriocheir TaxID=1081669 RepID=A0A1X0QHL6_9MICR|nr:hypothetical protein A0H76_1149 [Hepatospora eriocheir]
MYKKLHGGDNQRFYLEKNKNQKIRMRVVYKNKEKCLSNKNGKLIGEVCDGNDVKQYFEFISSNLPDVNMSNKEFLNKFRNSIVSLRSNENDMAMLSSDLTFNNKTPLKLKLEEV